MSRCINQLFLGQPRTVGYINVVVISRVGCCDLMFVVEIGVIDWGSLLTANVTSDHLVLDHVILLLELESTRTLFYS